MTQRRRRGLGITRPRQRADNGRYEVRYQEGGSYRARSFDRKGDADDFYTAERRRRQLGGPTLEAGRVTLNEFIETYWRTYATPNLGPRTIRTYGFIWAKHLRPRLGGYELRSITPAVVQDFRGQLERAKVGAPTVIKAMALLQGVLGHAVVREHLAANPAASVRKPRQRRPGKPVPLAPVTVERIRRALTLETRVDGRPVTVADHASRTLVCLLAYAGLRPEEAITRGWGDLHGGKLYVRDTKRQSERYVDVLAPVATDLAEWRLAQGRPGDNALIVPPPARAGRKGPDGAWDERDWRYWRRYIYRPAAIAAGVTGDLRPYRLRGSYVSLLLWEGRSLTYVADQAGHSVETLSRHYAGVLADLEGAARVTAATAIRKARSDQARRAM